MARLTLARKIAAITLTIWEKGACFDAKEITSASSLSVSGRELVPSSWAVVGSVLETFGSRGVSDSWFDPACSDSESPLSRYAPSENQK